MKLIQNALAFEARSYQTRFGLTTALGRYRKGERHSDSHSEMEMDTDDEMVLAIDQGKTMGHKPGLAPS
jgi:hypothetical protein